MAVPFLRHW
jgi:hypothetical protein